MIAQHGPLSVVWAKEWDGTWYSLNHVAPNRVHGSGIYIIWQGNDGQAIYVGQGSSLTASAGIKGASPLPCFLPYVSRGPRRTPWRWVIQEQGMYGMVLNATLRM